MIAFLIRYDFLKGYFVLNGSFGDAHSVQLDTPTSLFTSSLSLKVHKKESLTMYLFCSKMPKMTISRPAYVS